MCGGVLIAQEVILELESMQEEVGVSRIDTWVPGKILRSHPL